MAKRKPATEGITDLDGYSGSPRSDPASSHEPSLGSAPTPAEAEEALEKAEAAKKTAEAAKEDPGAKKPKPMVPYRVFAALSGMKAAKLAGFAHHVMSEEMKPATVVDWRERFTAFMNKPVKSLPKR